MAQCTAITRGGGRCKGVATSGSGLCYSHDPNHADARKRAARKGGQRGGRGRPQAELAALKDKLIALGDDVLEGRVDRSAGAVAAQIWNIAIGAIRTGLKVRETEELEKELEDLKAAFEAREGKRERWG